MKRIFLRLSALFAFAALAAIGPARADEPSAAVRALVGTPPQGKALIVFFRPSKFVGGGVGFKVREGEKVLGKLRNGKYFTSAVEPGAHTYVVHSEAKDVLNLEVEAGETYFVSGGITMGVIVGHPNIAPSTAADFEKVMKKLKLAKPVEQDDEKDEDEPKAEAKPKDAAPAEEPKSEQPGRSR